MKYFLIFLTACLLMSGCKKEPNNIKGTKDSPPAPLPGQVDIYVAGYEKNGNGKLIATVWKNGEAQSLTDGHHDAVAKSVFVRHDDVYAAGYEKNANNTEVATVWKNGVLLYRLTDGNNFSMANSVFVAGDKVIVAGVAHNGSKDVATVWRNHKPWELSYSGNNAWAHSVFLIQGEFRVAGFETKGTTNVAAYWKNETPDEYTIWGYTPNSNMTNTHDLTNGDADALATAAFIWTHAGSHVTYFAGYERNGNNKMVAKIWKPGASQSLSDGTNDATVTSLVVTENDIYAAGYEMTTAFKFIPRLWKNGEPVNLPNNSNNASAYSLSIAGSDVYIAGVEYTGGGNTAAILWKNGTATNLSATGAGALSVFTVITP